LGDVALGLIDELSIAELVIPRRVKIVASGYEGVIPLAQSTVFFTDINAANAQILSENGGRAPSSNNGEPDYIILLCPGNYDNVAGYDLLSNVSLEGLGLNAAVISADVRWNASVGVNASLNEEREVVLIRNVAFFENNITTDTSAKTSTVPTANGEIIFDKVRMIQFINNVLHIGRPIYGLGADIVEYMDCIAYMNTWTMEGFFGGEIALGNSFLYPAQWVANSPAPPMGSPLPEIYMVRCDIYGDLPIGLSTITISNYYIEWTHGNYLANISLQAVQGNICFIDFYIGSQLLIDNATNIVFGKNNYHDQQISASPIQFDANSLLFPIYSLYGTPNQITGTITRDTIVLPFIASATIPIIPPFQDNQYTTTVTPRAAVLSPPYISAQNTDMATIGNFAGVLYSAGIFRTNMAF
jgi:hypothetical protein